MRFEARINQKERKANDTKGERTRLTLRSTTNVHMYLFKKNDRYMKRAHIHVHTYAKVSVPSTLCVKYFSLRRIILSATSHMRDIKSNQEREIST